MKSDTLLTSKMDRHQGIMEPNLHTHVQLLVG